METNDGWWIDYGNGKIGISEDMEPGFSFKTMDALVRSGIISNYKYPRTALSLTVYGKWRIKQRPNYDDLLARKVAIEL